MLHNADFFVIRLSRLTEHDYELIIDQPELIKALRIERNATIIKTASDSFYKLILNYDRIKNNTNLAHQHPQLIRCFLRACSRATPYGLSSTSTLGKVSSNDNVMASLADVIVSHIEFSGEVVLSIINHFNRINIFNRSAYMILNPTISILGGRIRYMNNDNTHNDRFFYIEKKLSNEDILIIEFMQKPKRLGDIEKHLNNRIFLTKDYIAKAIAVGFIKPELCLPIHNRSGIKFITDYLRKHHPEHSTSISELESMNKCLGKYYDISLEDINLIEDRIKKLINKERVQISEKMKSYLLIDSTRELKNCTLSQSSVTNLLNNTEKLLHKTFRIHPLHQKLALKIHDEYGDEAIPINLLFDPKYGIDINNLPRFLSNEIYKANDYDEELITFLINLISDKSGTIDLVDFNRDVVISNDFTGGAVLAQVCRKSENYKFSLLSISGPEGIELFSRIALADDKFQTKMKDFLSKKSDNETGYLDLCRIPSAKGWHATMRPDLWANKLSFTGTYCDKSCIVSYMDLFARVENGLITLFHRDGHRILPRVSSPHDMLNIENLPLYRALACIGTPFAVGFNWPSIIDNVNFLLE